MIGQIQFILCIQDDQTAMQQLAACLKVFDMEINTRDPLDHAQTSAMLTALFTE